MNRVKPTKSQVWAGTVATYYMMETVYLELGLSKTKGHK